MLLSRTTLIVVSLLALTADAQTTQAPPEVRQIAGIIGIGDVVDQVETLRGQPASTETALQRLELRQRITDAIIEADLDVDATVASIQREESQIQAAQNILSSRRDRRVGLVTLASTIAGGGIGIIGSAMQFSDKTAYAGDGVSIASGAAATILSLVGVRLQRGGRRTIGVAPNMLARILDRPSDERSSYPDDVWTYLTSAPAGGIVQTTRIDTLKQGWAQQGRLPAPGAERKIAAMTTTFSEGMKLGLDDLSDRLAMLSELRAQVALMKRDLAALVRYMRRSGS